METRSNRDKVLQELRTHLGRDRARTRAFAVSELGLIEMTRQRVRPSLWQSMTIECPTCSGTGRVFRPEVVVRRMERSLKRAGADHKERQLSRSEEHTSELQSPCNLVCRLLLEKKKTTQHQSPCNIVCPLLIQKKKIPHSCHSSHRYGTVSRTRINTQPSLGTTRCSVVPLSLLY